MWQRFEFAGVGTGCHGLNVRRMRVSEIVALEIKHIDSDRMQIFVENAKGKKDRYVNLSPVLLDILRDYIKNYEPPANQLFI